jgi:alkanesulfonate monooxygenase SsuD/methylene tetrahydromethanopterin reductase-like flavin-dependent oxidoreductase (luciferase family)
MSPATRFGLFIGQVGLSWEQLAERFRLADELGFDHAWLVDHLMPTDGERERDCFEAWTALAGLAAVTRRVRLGVLVTSNTFRHPALLAKQATTVDHISGGRLILGIGTGWFEEEHRRFGLDFPAAAERVDRLEDALEVVTRLLPGNPVSLRTRHYRLEDARALPAPMQRPSIPILIAAHRPRMIRLAARYADVWDTFPTSPGTATDGVGEGLAARVARFEAACRETGRDPGRIRRSTWTGPSVLRNPESWREFVIRHRRMGFTDLIAGMPGPDDWPGLREVGRMLPALRSERQAELALRPVPAMPA